MQSGLAGALADAIPAPYVSQLCQGQLQQAIAVQLPQNRALQPASTQADVLMERLGGGDTDALDELLRLYWPPLVAYLKPLVSDWGMAEDFAQEAFLELWRHRADWKRSGSPVGFLYRVARHQALNELRHGRVLLRAAPDVRRSMESRQTPTPLDTLERAELRVAMEEAIEGLPPRRREVFTLGYLHGFKHNEIAQIMHVSGQTVKNQMSAALADLRRSLGPFLE